MLQNHGDVALYLESCKDYGDVPLSIGHQKVTAMFHCFTLYRTLQNEGNVALSLERDSVRAVVFSKGSCKIRD